MFHMAAIGFALFPCMLTSEQGSTPLINSTWWNIPHTKDEGIGGTPLPTKQSRF